MRFGHRPRSSGSWYGHLCKGWRLAQAQDSPGSAAAQARGKTVDLIVALFYFTARRNVTIGLLGNSDDHCQRTMYKRLEGIVRNTNELRRRIDPDKNFLNDYARLQDPKQTTTWQNRIIKCACSMAGAFGETLDILIASDLHATMDMEPFEAWRSALLDAKEGITLIDCQVDHIGGPIHALKHSPKRNQGVLQPY